MGKKNFLDNWRWLLLLCLLGACKQDQLPFYSGGNSVYFYKPAYSEGPDDYYVSDSATIYFCFNTADSTLALPVKLLGNITQKDRSYAFTVVTDSSTAVAGKDYEISARKVIPANGYTDTIMVWFKNRQLWQEGDSLVLLLHMEANDNFGLTMDNARGGWKNDYTWYPYRFKMKLVYGIFKPYFWDENEDYLGKFTPEKLRLMVGYFSLSVDKLVKNGDFYMYFQVREDATAFKQYLESEADKGNIIREADGTPMQMGPKA